MHTKTCARCDTEKPIDDFHRHAGSPDGRVAVCKPCSNARWSALRKERIAKRGNVAPPETKQCTKCGETKPISEFHKDVTQPLGVSYECKACRAIYTRAYRKRRPEVHREQERRRRERTPKEHMLEINQRARKRHYQKHKVRLLDYYREQRTGAKPGTHARLFAEQDGKCAICHRPPPEGKALNLDHCHDTKQIRGLLCHSCNVSIGHFRDDVTILRSAIAYLEKFPK